MQVGLETFFPRRRCIPQSQQQGSVQGAQAALIDPVTNYIFYSVNALTTSLRHSYHPKNFEK